MLGRNALNTLPLGYTGEATPITVAAGLTRGALNTAALNSYAIEYEIQPRATGRSHIYNSFEVAGGGVSDLVISSFEMSGQGQRIQRATYNATAAGASNQGARSFVLSGRGHHDVFNAISAGAVGISHLYGSFSPAGVGHHAHYVGYDLSGGGLASLGLGFDVSGRGYAKFLKPLHAKSYQQGYRVADDGLAGFEVYVGEGAMPDFTAPPAATGASLPITWPVPSLAAGETTVLHVVTRKRNKYGLLSHNQHPTLIEINESALEELGPITAPTVQSVLDGVSGVIKVYARYSSGVDRSEADSWELYVKEGADPDPDSDTAVAVATFGPSSAGYRWTTTATGLTAGGTYHVLVAVRRTEDGMRADSAVFTFKLAIAFDLDAGTAGMFAGQEHEIKT